ncbi:MAG: hypothetical protein MJ211_10130 [Bacteroidales bacterium]|nr:hypothetical protein [Bacteroidales bacterium]
MEITLKEAKLICDNYAYCSPISTFSKALCLSRATVDKRLSNGSSLKYDEIFLLSKAYQIPIKLFFNADKLPKYITIDYIDFSKHHTNFKYYFMDFKVAYEYKRYFNYKDFKIYMMETDRLANPNGYLYIRANDVVLVDTSETSIKRAGLYLYQCNNKSYHSIAYIEENFNGSVDFTFTYPEKHTKNRTKQELEELKFVVVGRVLKNVFYFH